MHVKESREVMLWMGVGGEGGHLEDLAKDQRKRRGPSLELVSLLSPKTKRAGASALLGPGSGGAALAPAPLLPDSRLLCTPTHPTAPRLFPAFSFVNHLQVQDWQVLGEVS